MKMPPDGAAVARSIGRSAPRPGTSRAMIAGPSTLPGFDQPRRDGRPAQEGAGGGGDADVAGDLDALVAVDRGDQLAQLLQPQGGVQAAPAGRGPGVDGGALRRRPGQVELEHPGPVAVMGPLEAG